MISETIIEQGKQADELKALLAQFSTTHQANSVYPTTTSPGQLKLLTAADVN